MKPRNFPARKLARRAKAQGWTPSSAQIAAARAMRTKKVRGVARKLAS